MNKLNFETLILFILLKSILTGSEEVTCSTDKLSDCQCKFLTNVTQTRIECYNLDLSSCTSLRFKNCDVTVITNNIFEMLPAVNEFEIFKCKLKSIEKQNFGGENNVKLINLAENQLKILPSGVFVYTPNVEKIFLYANQIESIDERSFFNLTKLMKISLYRNEIKYLPVGVFRTLRSLEWLSIADNHIDFIPEELFDGNPNLKDLYIFHNQLTIIDANLVKNRRSQNLLMQSRITESTKITSPRFFKNLTKLKILDLYGNHVPYMSEDMFSKLSDLERLDAGEVNLSYIESGSFSSQTKMKTLLIHKNRLEKIDINSLRNMIKLEKFWIDENEVKELDYRMLSQFSQQTTIYITKDNMNCTYFSNLVNFLKDRSNIHILPSVDTCSVLNRTTEHTSENPPEYEANVCVEPEKLRYIKKMFVQIQNKIDVCFKDDTARERENLVDFMDFIYSLANDIGFNLI